MWMQTEAVYLKINRLFVVVSTVFSIGLAVWYYVACGNGYRAFLSLVAPLFLLLPKICFWLFRLTPVPRVELASHIYCFLTFTGGMSLAAYHTIPYYDKAMHLLSGVAFCMVGLLFFYYLKPKKEIDNKEWRLAAIFSWSFSLAMAVLWEAYEYALDRFFGLDTQNVSTTGIHDTMQDMLICIAGATLFLIPMWRYYTKGREGFFMGALSSYFRLNIQNKD